MLGNWERYQFDGGGFTDNLDDVRAHDAPGGLANEITEWFPWPAGSTNNPGEPDYDRAGNMTSDLPTRRFIYDAWNRLVRIESDAAVPPIIVAEYEYDALNRRIVRTIGSDDPIHEYYTESWQRIESRPTSETSTVGASLYLYGIRYIDDIAARFRDTTGNGTPNERRYYLTDANYNVVMLVTAAGQGVERIFYNAYGVPEVFPFGDANGDYSVTEADSDFIQDIIDQKEPYNILADLNLDGVVDQTDLNLLSNYTGATGGWAVLTSSAARCVSSRLNSPRNAASMRPRSSRLIEASVPMPKSRANPALAMCYWAPARVASRHSAEELPPEDIYLPGTNLYSACGNFLYVEPRSPVACTLCCDYLFPSFDGEPDFWKGMRDGC